MSPPRAVWLWETHGWGKPTDHRMGMGECGDKLFSFSVAKKKMKIPEKPAGFTK